MRRTTKLSMAILLASTLFISCKKDNSSVTPTASPVPSAPTPSFGSDVDGALVSLRINFSYDPNKFASLPISVPVVDLEAESAVAVFGNLGTGAYSNAGTVSVNSNSLEKLSNNSYTKLAFDYTSADFSLDFSGGSSWSVGGSSDVTAFTYDHTQTFPNYSGRASMPETATTTSALTVSLSGVSNADSVYVLLAGNGKQVLKHLGSSASSTTFTAAEVASIGTTDGKATAFLEVCPWRYLIVSKNSKDYAFVKEYAVVKNVTIN